jgi:hypothetical protein
MAAVCGIRKERFFRGQSFRCLYVHDLLALAYMQGLGICLTLEGQSLPFTEGWIMRDSIYLERWKPELGAFWMSGHFWILHDMRHLECESHGVTRIRLVMKDIHGNNNNLKPLVISWNNKYIWSTLALCSTSLVNVCYFHYLVWLNLLIVVLIMKHKVERRPAAD